MSDCQAKDDGKGWIMCENCARWWVAPAWDKYWRGCAGKEITWVCHTPGPWEWWTSKSSLSDYTDEEIAKEYLLRIIRYE